MDIHDATRRYEAWMASHLMVIRADLNTKHREMAKPKPAFPFLRATFYRWAERWPVLCADLAAAPTVFAVGDLHVDNFGTWRDAKQRLIWGVNDLDEAHVMPYTNDLVRLAVSIGLAPRSDHVEIGHAQACDAILAGYTDCLEQGGKPFVLAEKNRWLRKILQHPPPHPDEYWQHIEETSGPAKRPLPPDVREALEHALPEPGMHYRVLHRIAGLGSLGRPRYLALAKAHGEKVAREAKALLPSAWAWVHDATESAPVRFDVAFRHAVRCPDSLIAFHGAWIVRALSPDSHRIELKRLSQDRDEARLLYAMGWETGNLHLGSGDAIAAVRRDLKQRPEGWLRDATTTMTHAVIADWDAWKRGPVANIGTHPTGLPETPAMPPH
jgi:hypothetical protein